MSRQRATARLRFAAGAVALLVGLTACSTSSASSRDSSRRARSASPAAPSAAPAQPRVAPFRHHLRPDVLVVGTRPLSAAQIAALRKLAPRAFTTFRSGTVAIARERMGALGVDPSSFRNFAPAGTAESDAVWAAVARGEAVVAHDIGERRKLPLGKDIRVGGKSILPLRLGALATTTLPGIGLIVSDAVGAKLGLAKTSGALLSSGRGDPTALAAGVRKIVGNAAHINLLTQPTMPFAFLTGSRAAKAFGAFSYRYFPDGTIEPDARWVRANIVDARVPILGVVTCHRLMVPQLRAALSEVVAAGLASKLRTDQYGGCYVPRFIERNPNRSVSLHTWGIAIDVNVPGNMPGSEGELDPRVVTIFKKWGFRWGGDWSPTDPMHFELGALLTVR